MKFLAVAVATAFALAGCATVVTGTSEDMAILTPPVSASCVLSNAEGSWNIVTPTVAHVTRSVEPLQIRCTKPGYRVASATIPSSVAGWTIGDIIAGGPFGAAVDASTGAINQYPHSFSLSMQAETPARAAN